MLVRMLLGACVVCLAGTLLVRSPGTAAAGRDTLGHINGVVVSVLTDGTMTPVPDIAVCVVRYNNWKKRKIICEEERPVTGPDGRFTARDLDPVRWVFLVEKDGFSQRPLGKSFSVYSGVTTQLDPPPPAAQLVEKRRKRGAIRGRDDNAADTASSPQGLTRTPRVVLTLYRRQQQGGGAAPQGPGENNAPRPGRFKLTGKVIDELGKEVSTADVFVSRFHEGETQVVAEGSSDSDGNFSLEISSLAPTGTYIFSVTRSGFHPYIEALDDVLDTSKEDDQSVVSMSKPVKLTRVGDLLSGGGPLVEKVEATRRHVFAPEVMQTLPIKGTRSFDEFALLAPGVLLPAETLGGVGPGVSAGVGTAGQFSVNGLRSRENNFTADGSDNNDEVIGTRRQGFIMTVPQPIESVQELQVITALGDVRFGRNIGGQVNVLTKTGGPGKFHGSLYAYATDNRLNARDPFDQTTATAPAGFAPRRASDGAPVLLDGAPLVRANQVGGEDQLTRVQLGFTVGGQLTEDADTSYFFSSEWQNVRSSREAHFAVPSVRQRGAFDSGDTGLLLLNKENPKTPLFPSSIPGDALFSLFPFPNNPAGPYGENTYSTVLPADGHGTRFSGKLEQQLHGDLPKCDDGSQTESNLPRCMHWLKRFFTFGDNLDQVTARINYTDELSTLPVTGGALFSSLRPKVGTHNFAFFINRTLSASTSDTIRGSVGGTRLSFGERRDASMLASSALPGESFLLNAPLLLNVTRPNAEGTLNTPQFVSAAGAGAARLNALGYQGVTQTEQITGPLGQVFVAGFSPLGVDVENFPQTRFNRTYQIADTVTSFVRAQVFTFGADVRRTRIDSSLNRNFRPRAVFHGLQSAPFNDALERPGAGQVQTGVLAGTTLAAAGVPTSLSQTLSALPDSFVKIRFTQVNFFFQDQWRATPTFHLTAGARYELNTVPDTSGRRLETAFNAEELQTLATQAAQSCVPLARCDDLVNALTSAAPADFEVSFGADRNNFDVRLGFAWAPLKLPNTTIRGGGATYRGQSPAIVIDQARNAFPDFLPLNLANFAPRSGNRTYLFNLANPALQQLLGANASVTPGTLNQLANANPVAFLVNQNLGGLSLTRTIYGLNLVLPQRRLQAPYAYHYGLTVEHQFGANYLASVAYIGTRGEQLLRVSTPDLGLNHSRFAGGISASPLSADQPFPYFSGQIIPPQPHLISQSFVIARTLFESSARSRYHSLQAEFRKRYRHALLVGSAFTYSHSIDDASDFFDNAGSFALPQNSLRRDERAPSNYDVRLRSTTHFVLDFQQDWFKLFGEWGSRALGGLQLSGIFTAQTGQPYTVNSAFDINRDGNLTDRLDTDAGIERVSGGGRVQLRLAPGVNPRDLLVKPENCQPPLDCDGAVGRNTFRTPGLYSFDFAVTHQLPSFGDSRRFVVRAEFFNLFNWDNYGVPVRILESPGFGRSISTRTSPRTIQFVGKFQF